MTCPLVDLATFKAFSGTTSADNDTALQLMLQEVSDAVVRRVRHPLWAASYTHYMDAPADQTLFLRMRFVTAVSSVRYRADGYGVDANYTSDYDLVEGRDWFIPFDAPDGSAMSWGGKLTRINAYWGGRYAGSPGRLSSRLQPTPLAVRAVYTAGFAAIPPAVVAAVNLAVSLLMGRRKSGMPVQSESRGAYSYSNAGPFTAEAAVNSPDVTALLSPFVPVAIA